MAKFFIIIFLIFSSINLYASPYATPWLYDKMIDYIKNPSLYKNDFKHGIVENKNPDIIVGAFIERAYDIYLKEEKYNSQITSCGDNCYKDASSKNIIDTYNKFFYKYAIAFPITSILLQNPKVNENISYYMQNKKITYTWKSNKNLLISVNNNTLEFKQTGNNIIITTDIQDFKNYVLLD